MFSTKVVWNTEFCCGSVQAMCANMLLDGSVLWSLCFERPTRLWKPCRRCGARRLSPAVKRAQRRRRSTVALSMLLLLPLLGMAVAVPGAATVLLAPLVLASMLRCWCLNVTVCNWQACGRCIVFRDKDTFFGYKDTYCSIWIVFHTYKDTFMVRCTFCFVHSACVAEFF